MLSPMSLYCFSVWMVYPFWECCNQLIARSCLFVYLFLAIQPLYVFWLNNLTHLHWWNTFTFGCQGKCLPCLDFWITTLLGNIFLVGSLFLSRRWIYHHAFSWLLGFLLRNLLIPYQEFLVYNEPLFLDYFQNSLFSLIFEFEYNMSQWSLL